MVEIRQYDMEYTYDYDLDVINIEVKQDYPHKETVELEFGVFLDFNENDFPINLEIVSASKIVGVDKKLLCNPDGNVKVVIGEDIIEVNVCFKFKDSHDLVKFRALNDYSIQTSEISFALA